MTPLFLLKVSLGIVAGICAIVPFFHSWWNYARARAIRRLPTAMVQSRTEYAWEWSQWKATMTAFSVLLGVVLNFFP